MPSLESLLEDKLFISRFDVFYWENYEFDDGTIRNKYWITLNCEINDFPINIILPTSNKDGRFYSNENNWIDCVLIKSGESEHFSTDTIIDLRNISKEHEDNIKEAFEDSILVRCGELEHNLCERIIEAIKNSETLTPFEIDEYLCNDS